MTTKPTRKNLSKRTRFEVFKRDAFTCQYCGAKAPDVMLHVDHIQPVSKGGHNGVLNLATACLDCNFGKSDKPLVSFSESLMSTRKLRSDQIDPRIHYAHAVLKNRLHDRTSNFLEELVYLHLSGSMTPNEILNLCQNVKHDIDVAIVFYNHGGIYG